MINNLKYYQIFDDNTFTKRDIETEGKTKRFVLNFMPGQILPTHQHPKTTLFFHVIEGKGRFFLDQHSYSITAHDFFYCHGDQGISVENNGKERLSIYVIMIPNP